MTLVACGVGALMLLNPAKFRYRELTWYTDRELTVAERLDAWGTALMDVYSGRRTEDAVDMGADSLAYRTSSLPSVANIFEAVPMLVPYAGPEQWLMVPLLYVPRVFWPDKPIRTEMFNNTYTMAFGIQTTRGAQRATMNLPSVGDGYWRLGWFGVALEGMLAGLAIGFFQGLTLVPARSTLLLGVAFAIATQADKHVMHLLSGLPQLVIAMVAAILIVRVLAFALGATQRATPPPGGVRSRRA